MYIIPSLLGVLLVFVCGSALFLLPNDKYALFLFSICSLGFSMISLPYYNLPIALVFLLTGISSALILWFAGGHKVQTQDKTQTMLRFPAFRSIFLLLSLSLSLIFYSAFYPFFRFPPFSLLAPSLFVIILGLFQLGLSERPFWVAISLLILFQAFTVLYGWVELSVLVVGLCALVQLTVALTCAYVSFPHSESAVAR
jgi:hypothetical protein